MEQKSGIVYFYGCQELDYDDEYMGESARTLGKDSRNIKKHHYSYMAAIPPLATPPHRLTSVWWGGARFHLDNQGLYAYKGKQPNP